MKKQILTAAGVCLFMAQSALAAPVLSDFVVFGKTSVTIGSGTGSPVSAAVGSGGSVTIQQNGTLGDGDDAIVITGGGAYTGGQNSVYVGDIIFGGSVSLAQNSKVTGSVHTGGAVTMGNGAQVSGDVVAGGSVSLGNNNAVGGSVQSGGRVVTGSNASVAGTVSATGTVALGSNPNVGGVVQGAPAPTPLAPPVIDLPDANVFSAGGANQSVAASNTLGLLADVYGALNVGNNGKVQLSSGEYFFDSMVFGNGGILELDLSLGGIVVNIVGDFLAGNNFEIALIGGDASDVLFEVHGDATFGQGAEWAGTLFAPDGTITFGNNSVIQGALYGDIIKIGNNSNLGYAKSSRMFRTSAEEGDNETGEPGATQVPVPAPLASLLVGLMALGYVRRRAA